MLRKLIRRSELLRRLFVFNVINGHSGFHECLSRRELLRVGALGLGGLTLTDLLRHDANAATETHRPKSVIYVVLDGGPSHLDMWDLKPQAPTEYGHDLSHAGHRPRREAAGLQRPPAIPAR